MTLVTLLPQILLILGVGFLVANLRLGLDLWRWSRRRSTALITWPARRPPLFGLSLGLGVILGVLILLEAYLAWTRTGLLIRWIGLFVKNAFGELMMFVYFGYMLPLSMRITRGLYDDGIWTDTTFMRFDQIGGISWRDGENPTLVIISRVKSFARRLEVPARFLGEVRRVLRDKIRSHAIAMDEGPGLHLGARDARDSV